MKPANDETATCRHCGKELRGKPYHLGGRAYLSSGREAPSNYYGGFVCSRECDYRTSLELEESMPGHGGQSRLDARGPAMRRVDANWS